MELFESLYLSKTPYWVLALSVLTVASTSIGIECLTQCNCKGRHMKHSNLRYLEVMTAFAVLGIVLSGVSLAFRFV
jgi:hypothetical protein